MAAPVSRPLARSASVRSPIDPRQALGALGERVAARWLERQGWAVIARRFRSGHRDLDLVARRDDLVAFVEVKARRGLGFGDPVAAVGWRKRRELGRSAAVWVDRFGRPGEAYRFDVIGVLLTPAGVRIRHVADAFGLPPPS
ncbi:YraN family protein [Roseisolibacter sp. H3M3-2]|uniref:YraN family protein n=1 Tax=Roseisolibacter sp. H3M3-2 TaxID=3031323 RepID=UPI0023DCD33D|nr:YraN family protein [Roseisolibacter sp. H3M3-2]MDF1505013.1 YraN family protein [Roseisolibacter sp. H3M3-2]